MALVKFQTDDLRDVFISSEHVTAIVPGPYQFIADIYVSNAAGPIPVRGTPAEVAAKLRPIEHAAQRLAQQPPHKPGHVIPLVGDPEHLLQPPASYR